MKIYFLILALSIFVSCHRKNELIVTKINEQQNFMIKSKSENPSVLSIKFEGKINDTCMVMGQKIAPNNLGKEYFFDSYSDKVLIVYKPYKAQKGSLIIIYDYK